MSSGRITRLISIITALLLIVLLAASFSCNRSSGGGGWNSEGLAAVEISRLSLPERDNGYDNFESTIIQSQDELDDFISDIQ